MIFPILPFIRKKIFFEVLKQLVGRGGVRHKKKAGWEFRVLEGVVCVVTWGLGLEGCYPKP